MAELKNKIIPNPYKENLNAQVMALNKLIEAESLSTGKSSMLPRYLAQREILSIKANTNRAERRKNFKKLFVGK